MCYILYISFLSNNFIKIQYYVLLGNENVKEISSIFISSHRIVISIIQKRKCANFNDSLKAEKCDLFTKYT